jgi:hypothetical protein
MSDKAAESTTSPMSIGVNDPYSHLHESSTKDKISTDPPAIKLPDEAAVDGRRRSMLPTSINPIPSTAETRAGARIEDGDIQDNTIRTSQDLEAREEESDHKADLETARPDHGITFDERPYSIFTHNEKRIIVLCAGFCAFFSPASGQIYFPALNEISADLHVSHDLINLTITSYLVSLFPARTIRLLNHSRFCKG